MGDYTKLKTAEAQEILDLYGKGKITSLHPLSLGISNSNYRVETEESTYLLKVSNDKSQGELEEEMEILLYLKERGFSYSLVPYKTVEGHAVYRLEDAYGVLFPFLDGIPPGPSDIACEEIGRGLAKLHTIPTGPQTSNLRNHIKVGFGAKEVFEYIKTGECPSDYKELFELMYPHQLQWFMDADWERGIIHGDLYYDNTLFKNEKLQCLLDFEQGGIGEYILDLGISISGTCLEKGRLIPPLIKSYLRGYEEIRPLPKEEKLHLADAIGLGLFSISLWRIKRFKEKDLNPLMAESYRELLLRAQMFNESLKVEPLT